MTRALTHTTTSMWCQTEAIQLVCSDFWQLSVMLKTHVSCSEPGVNFINTLRSHFLYKCLFGSFSLVTCKWKKLPTLSYVKFVHFLLIKLTAGCQFHQQFTCTFFCFVTFWRKNISSKAAYKMLMKLTTGVNFINILFVHFTPIFLHHKILKPKHK